MNSSARRNGQDGSFSDGFITTRIAGDQRHAGHPQRNHRREVERGDAGDDAERLAHRVNIDAARDVVGKLALLRMRRTAGEFAYLDAAQHRAHGVFDDLAVFVRYQRGQFFLVLVEQLHVARHDARAL